jgi:hypothetical protein
MSADGGHSAVTWFHHLCISGDKWLGAGKARIAGFGPITGRVARFAADLRPRCSI